MPRCGAINKKTIDCIVQKSNVMSTYMWCFSLPSLLSFDIFDNSFSMFSLPKSLSTFMTWFDSEPICFMLEYVKLLIITHYASLCSYWLCWSIGITLPLASVPEPRSRHWCITIGLTFGTGLTFQQVRRNQIMRNKARRKKIR